MLLCYRRGTHIPIPLRWVCGKIHLFFVQPLAVHDRTKLLHAVGRKPAFFTHTQRKIYVWGVGLATASTSTSCESV